MKKGLSLVLAAVFATTMFAGTALAEKKTSSKEELLKEQIKIELKQKEKLNTKVTAQIKVVEQKKQVAKSTTVTKKVVETKKTAQTKKVVKKYNYDKKKLKKELWMLKEKFNQMQKPVTYQQALTLTVRAMGYDGVAVDKLDTKFKYAAWAEKAVGVAVYKGIVTLEELNKYNPNKPITRTDLAVLLVKAKGESVTEGAYPNVKDAAKIPADKAPYVAKALEKGWFTAYKDGEFKPFKPVTRAIFASAFIKAGFDASSFMPKNYTVSGILADAAKTPNAITINTKGAELTYAVYDKAVITVNGKEATFADLTSGMSIKVKIADNVAVEIKAANKIAVTDAEDVEGDSDEDRNEEKATKKK